VPLCTLNFTHSHLGEVKTGLAGEEEKGVGRSIPQGKEEGDHPP
jgi:hypothetical protein